MALALPIAVFVFSFLILHGRNSTTGQTYLCAVRNSLIHTVILWGTSSVLIIEILGWLTAINKTGTAAAWAIVLFVCLFVGIRTRYLSAGWTSIRQVSIRSDRSSYFLIVVMATIGAVLLLLAWISPSNNVDSLLYHLPRVAYWVQSGSLDHYAANYHHQLSMPIWAETTILQIRVLAASDDLANLVQWGSMVGSVIGVSAIAALMCGSTLSQLVASAFAMSIPMGILQATSTQNDYVASLWTVSLAYLVVSSVTHKNTSSEWAYIGLALGLGLLTKATVYVYALPFLLWYLVAIMRKESPGRALRSAILVAAIAALLNIGYWGRNLATYGTPFGPSETIRRAVVILPEPSLSEGAGPSGTEGSAGNSLIARTSTALARNFMTPHTGLNRAIASRISLLQGVIQATYEQEMTTAIWNHEDTAGNPLHLLALPGTILLLAFAARKGRLEDRKWVWIYLTCVAGGFVLLASLLSNGASLVGLRFQLTFFVLWAPLAGVSMIAFKGNRVPVIVGGAFLLASIPWILLNNTRPLLAPNDWITRTDSVPAASESEVMFAMAPELREQYAQMGSILTGSGCKQVGYRIDSSDPGYLLWWILGAPESGIRLESVYTYPELERYLDPEYKPCAVICTSCDGMKDFMGLSLKGKYADALLFLK